MLINIPKDLGKPEVVPPGIYKVRCTGYKTRNSAAGNLCISPEYTIQTQGPDESVKTIGRKVFDNWTITESALGIVNDKFKALTGKSITDIVTGEIELEDLVNRITSEILNKECLADVKVKPRQDNPEVFVNDIGRLSPIHA